MYQFTSETNIFIQGMLVAVMIGVFYNLIVTTSAYGGIIGKAIRLIGIGIAFFSIAMVERSLVNFSVVEPTLYTDLIQDVLNLAGLVFLGLGFSKLAASTRQ